MAKNLKVGKDKYINVALRFKNVTWTAALLVQIVNFVIFIIRAFGGNVSGSTEENLGSIIQVLAMAISSVVGRFMDPTTSGTADSERNLAKTRLTTNDEKSLQAMDYDGSVLPPVKPFLEQNNNQETTNLQNNQNSNESNFGGGSIGSETIDNEVNIDSNYNPEIFGGGSSSEDN